MTKARRELAALMPSQDVIIEVLDARLPAASSNPLLTELRKQKPCIKVLTRSDLADPRLTEAWLEHFRSQPNVSAFMSTTDRPQDTRRQISELSRGMALHRGPTKRVRALIAGVPNVGKSTLLNILMNRNVAVVGDKPAITKQQQAVILKDGTTLTDSPGLLWPKIEDEDNAFRLALAGSIPDTAIDYLTIAMFGARLLLERYAPLARGALQADHDTCERRSAAHGDRQAARRAAARRRRRAPPSCRDLRARVSLRRDRPHQPRSAVTRSRSACARAVPGIRS